MLLVLEVIDDENECLQLENLYNEYGKEMFHQSFEILNNELAHDKKWENSEESKGLIS